MGGPSKTEIRSDDTLTKYIDGEITDKLLLELFEHELSEDPKLQYRLQNMVAIKSQIVSILETSQIKPTEFVKNEIRNTVVLSASQMLEVSPDDDSNELEVTDAELLINSLIDDELADGEVRIVEKLITDNDTYRELYEQLVTSKIKISDTLIGKNLEPNAKIKMDIKSLVARELERPSRTAGMPTELVAYHESGIELPSPRFGTSDMMSNVADSRKNLINSESLSAFNASRPQKNRLANSFNYYAQRLVPLAAVFVAGLYISPMFLYTNAAITLRGGGAEVASNKDFGFVSIVQSQDQLVGSKQTNILLSQLSFHLLLTAPTSGEMFIALETSNQKDVSKVPKGKTVKQIGVVEVGQLVRYPATQDLTVDETDKLLRIDIEIRSDDKIFSFTEFVTIDQG